jgi:hypothetical protein
VPLHLCKREVMTLAPFYVNSDQADFDLIWVVSILISTS